MLVGNSPNIDSATLDVVQYMYSQQQQCFIIFCVCVTDSAVANLLNSVHRRAILNSRALICRELKCMLTIIKLIYMYLSKHAPWMYHLQFIKLMLLENNRSCRSCNIIAASFFMMISYALYHFHDVLRFYRYMTCFCC